MLFLQRKIQEANHSCATMRMSAPLKDIAFEFLPVEKKHFSSDEKKDLPFNHLGTTFRDLQIQTFFLGAKLLGPDWLGQKLLKRLRQSFCSVVLVPDSGRPEEIQPLLDAKFNIFHLKLTRPGTSFSGDSRVDFSLPVPTEVIENSGDIASLYSSLLPIVSKILSRLELTTD